MLPTEPGYFVPIRHEDGQTTLFGVAAEGSLSLLDCFLLLHDEHGMTYAPTSEFPRLLEAGWRHPSEALLEQESAHGR